MKRSDQILFEYLEKLIKVSLYKDNRVGNIFLYFESTKLELVLLMGANDNKVLKFLLKKEKWIRIKLSNIQQNTNVKRNNVKFYKNILRLGCSSYIKYFNRLNKFSLKKKNNRIIINILKFFSVKILTEYMKIYSVIEIKRLVKFIGKEYYLTNFSNLLEKDLESKWGSCFFNGNLSFNWRIVFTFQSLFYYIVIHEMSHLKEMNHSDRFWLLVKKIAPDYKFIKYFLDVFFL